MRTVKLSINKVHADPANARRHSDRNIQAIAASLARFGQQKPIVIDSQNVVRAGSGTLDAARALDWTHIDCVRSDLKSVDLSAYSLADNRSAELADWDDDNLRTALQSLVEAGVPLEDMGFDAADLENLLGEMVNDPSSEWDQMPEFEHEDQNSVQRIQMHFATLADVQAFAKLIGQEIGDKTRSMWYPPADIGTIKDKRYGKGKTDGKVDDAPA